MLPEILSSFTQRRPGSEFCADAAPCSDFGAVYRSLRKGSFWQTNGLGLLCAGLNAGSQTGSNRVRLFRVSCVGETC